jgi:DNA-binding response OmpR family regulator
MVITSLVDDETRADCLRTGADDFVTKPVDWPTFADRVMRLIERAGWRGFDRETCPSDPAGLPGEPMQSGAVAPCPAMANASS